VTGSLVVTGATGSIGRAVLAAAATAGLEAVAIDRGMLEMGDPAVLAARLRSVRPRAIIHLAAATPARIDPADAEPYAATQAVAERLRDALLTLPDPPRVVHASSAAVYGDQGSAPFAEQAPLVGDSAYARSKRAAEQLWAAAPVAATALRVFNVVGPGQPGSLVTRLRRSSAEHPVELRAPAQFVRDYVHVDDVADAMLRAALSEQSGDLVLNVGSGVGISSAELVARLRASGETPVIIEVDGPPSYSVADVSAIAELLGWRARRDVTDWVA
jgi:nucleoside-diphosphate-sugar epimerase